MVCYPWFITWRNTVLHARLNCRFSSVGCTDLLWPVMAGYTTTNLGVRSSSLFGRASYIRHLVDLFIAPSKFLRQRYLHRLGYSGLADHYFRQWNDAGRSIAAAAYGPGRTFSGVRFPWSDQYVQGVLQLLTAIEYPSPFAGPQRSLIQCGPQRSLQLLWSEATLAGQSPKRPIPTRSPPAPKPPTDPGSAKSCPSFPKAGS